ncbi:MAG: flagellar motor protein MotB [Alphaproteobacteria bacterium]|nr:flagellar motor protein MotB [Alphaproteobacteria bacterium]
MTDLLDQPIIIKKVKKGGHGHHGGAWKVAYADFVTAMMAFFLLLWLLNATTEEQKSGLADYFSPASVSSTGSGSGGVLGGQSISVEGNQVSAGGPTEGGATLPIPPSQTPPAEVESDDPDAEVVDSDTAEEVVQESVDELLARHEQEQFEAAEDSLRDAIESIPELEALQDSLVIEQTPEGLRIQLIDQAGYPMFASGSANANEQLIQLIGLVTQIVTQLPNKLAISGHTDSVPFRNADGYTNWELSSDRANAARRLLVEGGLDEERVANVQGRSATEPFVPEDTTDPSNRRISIVLLRENTPGAPIFDENSGPTIFSDEREVERAPAPKREVPLEDARTQNISPRG